MNFLKGNDYLGKGELSDCQVEFLPLTQVREKLPSTDEL